MLGFSNRGGHRGLREQPAVLRPRVMQSLAVGCALWCASVAWSQSSSSTEPTVGLAERPGTDVVLEQATVVGAPGDIRKDTTVHIRGSSIVAVGREVEVPAGAERIDCRGKYIYPGLIDAFSEVDVPLAADGAAAGYWNRQVTPERTTEEVAAKAISVAGKLRSQGITARLLAPSGGVIKGTSRVVLLTDASEPFGDSSLSAAGSRVLADPQWMHGQLTVPRDRRGERYPNSPMGAVALFRQACYDAKWYEEAWQAYEGDPRLTRPENNRALAELAQALAQATLVLDAENERMALRADDLAREIRVGLVLRGSGREYRAIDELAATGRTLLLPVDFPKAPDVSTAAAARQTPLRDLMHWDLAPQNPAIVAAAGLPFCLTTDGLDNPSNFLARVRDAVAAGLDADAALRAVTIEPAGLLGIEDVAGRVAPGMLASLVVTDGPLFDAKTKVLQTWVAGQPFRLKPLQEAKSIAGDYRLRLKYGKAAWNGTLKLTTSGGKWQASLQRPPAAAAKKQDDPDDAKDEEATPAEEEPVSVKLEKLTVAAERMIGRADVSKLDGFPEGVTRIAAVPQPAPRGKTGAPSLLVRVTWPAGDQQVVTARPITEPQAAADDEAADEQNPAEDAESEDAEPAESDAEGTGSDAARLAATPLLYPLGAYGLSEPLADPGAVVFRNATVWTCDEAGILEEADVLIKDGLIVAVGVDLEVPAGCQSIDAKGKHITPGIIDCHSHMATDGGINESGQAVTAEVRIGDFLDNSDIAIYRQLAGGVTVASVLHGSANPIGGQNAVIKLRWGMPMDALRMQEAPPGIKFALGENVKRSSSRYPNTRMGVEAMLRDQFLAARQYVDDHRRWSQGRRSGLPPRRDLQLEAIAEVLRGERWVHCHSYRQDEIVATLKVLAEFNVQIGTLQHILEGYKVANEMAEYGAMGSSFSDWWAYKFEVFDAIPYNGALMRDRGVVVSFNSDDRELARHLNTEAAKAVKYGGVPPEEALKFVTLNPAKQLRIDDYVGSLTPGKQADLVVWSGPPMSTTSRCEQTWVDGRNYFSLQADRQLRQRDAKLHAALVQRVLQDRSVSERAAANQAVASESIALQVEEEDRWVRYDIFCAAKGRGEEAARARRELQELENFNAK